MPKRGRPISTDINDPIVILHRQQTAERTRQYRQRRQLQVAATQAQQTAEQAAEAELVAKLPFEDPKATQTLLQLGLRISNLTLAQDLDDAQLQQEARPIDEHTSIYRENSIEEDV